MIGDPIPDQRDALLAKLNNDIDQFFAKGGEVTPVAGVESRPLPPRSAKVDPETVLARRRRRPNTGERSALRQMAEAL